MNDEILKSYFWIKKDKAGIFFFLFGKGDQVSLRMFSLPPTLHFFFYKFHKELNKKGLSTWSLRIAKCLIHEGVKFGTSLKITPEIHRMGWVRLRWQSRKTLSSPPLMSPPKPQLPEEQSSMKKMETYQKRSSTTKDIKKEPQWDRYKRWTLDIIKSHTLRWVPTNRRIIIVQRFSHSSKSSEPQVRLPSPGVRHWEDELWEHLALKSSWASFQEAHRTGGNKEHTQNLMCVGTEVKSSYSIGAWARPTCWSWRVSQTGGGGRVRGLPWLTLGM